MTVLFVDEVTVEEAPCGVPFAFMPRTTVAVTVDAAALGAPALTASSLSTSPTVVELDALGVPLALTTRFADPDTELEELFGVPIPLYSRSPSPVTVLVPWGVPLPLTVRTVVPTAKEGELFCAAPLPLMLLAPDAMAILRVVVSEAETLKFAKTHTLFFYYISSYLY